MVKGAQDAGGAAPVEKLKVERLKGFGFSTFQLFNHSTGVAQTFQPSTFQLQADMVGVLSRHEPKGHLRLQIRGEVVGNEAANP